MLQNEYLDAKIGVDTAENEPSKAWPACLPRDPPLRSSKQPYIPVVLRAVRGSRQRPEDRLGLVHVDGLEILEAAEDRREAEDLVALGSGRRLRSVRDLLLA